MSDNVPLKITQLHKSFGSVRAVEDLSLAVITGEIFGLIGPDGGGKTTAMRIACGLLLAQSGKIEIMGIDPGKQPRKAKSHIGYMPQRFSLYPDLSIAENIRFFADLYEVSGQDRVQREERLMQFSRLAQFRDRRAGKLSGGMKQKLALSCTLIHTPKVLILDEPTTGVDPVSRKEFWALLKELANDGLAILVSTPYMDEALLCNHIALMHKGKVIGQGTPQKVVNMFPWKLLEIIGNDISSARSALQQLDGIVVHRFGDRLHVIYKEESELQAIKQKIMNLEVSEKPINPSMEDTFMALMGAA